MHTSIHKCFTPCIYYHEIHNKFDKPSVKVICDYRDGTEIRLIPEVEINNCPHFKTYKQVKESHKEIFSSHHLT